MLLLTLRILGVFFLSLLLLLLLIEQQLSDIREQDAEVRSAQKALDKARANSAPDSSEVKQAEANLVKAQANAKAKMGSLRPAKESKKGK